MYKKALKKKLRFKTGVGSLSVEQLMDLNLTQLAMVAKQCSKDVKKLTDGDEDDLDFLESTTDSTELEDARLRFSIVKDIYQTKKQDLKDARDNATVDEQLRHLETLLARKKDQELENMSVDDLEKKIAELRDQKK